MSEEGHEAEIEVSNDTPPTYDEAMRGNYNNQVINDLIHHSFSILKQQSNPAVILLELPKRLKTLFRAIRVHLLGRNRVALGGKVSRTTILLIYSSSRSTFIPSQSVQSVPGATESPSPMLKRLLALGHSVLACCVSAFGKNKELAVLKHIVRELPHMMSALEGERAMEKWMW